jgi:hypothetical protein
MQQTTFASVAWEKKGKITLRSPGVPWSGRHHRSGDRRSVRRAAPLRQRNVVGRLVSSGAVLSVLSFLLATRIHSRAAEPVAGAAHPQLH